MTFVYDIGDIIAYGGLAALLIVAGVVYAISAIEDWRAKRRKAKP